MSRIYCEMGLLPMKFATLLDSHGDKRTVVFAKGAKIKKNEAGDLEVSLDPNLIFPIGTCAVTAVSEYYDRRDIKTKDGVPLFPTHGACIAGCNACRRHIAATTIG